MGQFVRTKNDVIINKITKIESCLKRIGDTYTGKLIDLENFDIQDIVTVNLWRACQAAIDLAMHICMAEKLGAPQTSADAFEFLYNEEIITKEVADKMKKMVGFRNIAAHDYQSLNLNILKNILDHHLTDFTDFTSFVLKTVKID